MRAPRHWFLPESPDVLELLRRQVAVTIDGIDAFAVWAAGDPAAAKTVRELEHRADAAKRDLQGALREAFVTPLEPEDLFAVSRGVDRILNQAKDLVRESEVMACAPDTPVADMAAQLSESLRALDGATARLEPRAGDATEAAEAAIKHYHRIERIYRAAMAELLEVDDLREVMARRELYRRCSRMGRGSTSPSACCTWSSRRADGRRSCPDHRVPGYRRGSRARSRLRSPPPWRSRPGRSAATR